VSRLDVTMPATRNSASAAAIKNFVVVSSRSAQKSLIGIRHEPSLINRRSRPERRLFARARRRLRLLFVTGPVSLRPRLGAPRGTGLDPARRDRAGPRSRPGRHGRQHHPLDSKPP